MSATPASNEAVSKGPAGATTATESPGRSGRVLWKLKSVGQGLQIAHQRSTTAIQLVQALRGIAQCNDVLHRRVVEAAVGVAGGQPLACRRGVTSRKLTAHGDDGERAGVHHFSVLFGPLTGPMSAKNADDS